MDAKFYHRSRSVTQVTASSNLKQRRHQVNEATMYRWMGESRKGAIDVEWLRCRFYIKTVSILLHRFLVGLKVRTTTATAERFSIVRSHLARFARFAGSFRKDRNFETFVCASVVWRAARHFFDSNSLRCFVQSKTRSAKYARELNFRFAILVLVPFAFHFVHRREWNTQNFTYSLTETDFSSSTLSPSFFARVRAHSIFSFYIEEWKRTVFSFCLCLLSLSNFVSSSLPPSTSFSSLESLSHSTLTIFTYDYFLCGNDSVGQCALGGDDGMKEKEKPKDEDVSTTTMDDDDNDDGDGRFSKRWKYSSNNNGNAKEKKRSRKYTQKLSLFVFRSSQAKSFGLANLQKATESVSFCRSVN